MNSANAHLNHASNDLAPLIYIVDDQPELLDLAEISLMSDGYRFKKFEDPTLAFKSFQNETTKPALLLTDYQMDSMNGIQLLTLCKRAHPALKTVLISGTAGPEVFKETTERVDRFLPKPYTPKQLAELVRAVLAE